MYNLLKPQMPELEVLPAALDLGIGGSPTCLCRRSAHRKARQTPPGSRTREVEREYELDLSDNRQLDDFADLCRNLGEPPHVVAIAWVLANPAVASAIVGVRKLEHLDGLARAAELTLDADVMARLEETFNINRGRPLRPGPAPEAYSW